MVFPARLSARSDPGDRSGPAPTRIVLKGAVGASSTSPRGPPPLPGSSENAPATNALLGPARWSPERHGTERATADDPHAARMKRAASAASARAPRKRGRKPASKYPKPSARLSEVPRAKKRKTREMSPNLASKSSVNSASRNRANRRTYFARFQSASGIYDGIRRIT